MISNREMVTTDQNWSSRNLKWNEAPTTEVIWRIGDSAGIGLNIGITGKYELKSSD